MDRVANLHTSLYFYQTQANAVFTVYVIVALVHRPLICHSDKGINFGCYCVEKLGCGYGYGTVSVVGNATDTVPYL